MPEIQFVRNKKYGTVGTGKNGWAKEVCNVSWNQKGPKLDLREWSPDYQKMSRGITLTKQEAKRLLSILANVDFEEFDTVAMQAESSAQIKPVQQKENVVVVMQEPVQNNTAGSTIVMDLTELEDESAEMLPSSV